MFYYFCIFNNHLCFTIDTIFPPLLFLFKIENNSLLLDIDSAIQHILAIGVLLAFKNLLSEALNEVLDRRLPFLMNSVQDISKAYDLKGNVQKDINDLLYSCGYSSQIDIGLYETLSIGNRKCFFFA